MVTNGITYGVTSLQSESVSYTKDGKTMNVKQALDDLIVKVDQKSGNFNITLAEQSIVNGKTVDATTYKTIVNGLIDKMVSAMGSTGTMSELTALKSATLTWTSENSTIASVSGTTVTGKSVGHTKIIGTDSTGKKVTVPVNVIAGEYLATKANVGDYVAYDAGDWGGATSEPTAQGKFGGNGVGNRGNSVKCNGYTPNKKGWRVLKKENNQVYLVHAGQPECYYHASGYSDASVKALNNRTQQYMNKYADSAHAMTQPEANALTQSSDLRTTGAHYWLATANGSYSLYYVITGGGIIYDSDGYSRGLRPVVVLKSTVLTTGTGNDQVGNSGAWILA